MRPADKTVAALLSWAEQQLQAAEIAQPLLDARRLLAEALKQTGAVVALYQLEQVLSENTIERFQAMLGQRLQRQPVAQIIGYRAFYQHDFIVNTAVLDPRPDSETLVEAALEVLSEDQSYQVLDLGVGSGCLLLSILALRPLALGTGIDLSLAALNVAQQNAERLKVLDRVTFKQSDWLAEVEGDFDVILCNPPYISAQEMQNLQPEVLNWEPHLALTPGGDGLVAYRHLAQAIKPALKKQGVAFFELGHRQAAMVSEIFSQFGWRIQLYKDLNDVARVLKVWR